MTILVMMQPISMVRQQLMTAENIVVEDAKVVNTSPTTMMDVVGARQVKKRGITMVITHILLGTYAQSWVG